MKNGKMKNDRQRTFMLITIPVVILFSFSIHSRFCEVYITVLQISKAMVLTIS